MKSASAVAAALAALTLAGLAGCSSTTKLTYLPSGETGFAINCSGSDASESWGECYRQAGEACGAYGYDVISKDVDNGATSRWLPTFASSRLWRLLDHFVQSAALLHDVRRLMRHQPRVAL